MIVLVDMAYKLGVVVKQRETERQPLVFVFPNACLQLPFDHKICLKSQFLKPILLNMSDLGW